MYSAERHFVTTAYSQLRLLERGGPDANTDIETAIGQIKAAAGPVKARAVYRAALLCEDVFKRSGSATDIKFCTALARLKSLVVLYGDGLFEIDPEFKAVLNENKLHNTKNDLPTPIPEIQMERLKAANQNAAAVLQPLLRLVKNEGQADALAFISGYSRQSKIVQAKPELKTQQPLSVKFDGLMRQVTNQTLSEARARAKNVSISYAADFDSLDLSIAPDVQTVLQQACLDIVRKGVVVTGDLVSSLNRSWQISVTGEIRGQDLVIILSWRGEALQGLREKGRDALQRLNGKITCRENKTGTGETPTPSTQVIILICPLRIEGKTKGRTAGKVAEKMLPVRNQVLQTRVRRG